MTSLVTGSSITKKNPYDQDIRDGMYTKTCNDRELHKTIHGQHTYIYHNYNDTPGDRRYVRSSRNYEDPSSRNIKTVYDKTLQIPMKRKSFQGGISSLKKHKETSDSPSSTSSSDSSPDRRSGSSEERSSTGRSNHSSSSTQSSSSQEKTSTQPKLQPHGYLKLLKNQLDRQMEINSSSHIAESGASTNHSFALQSFSSSSEMHTVSSSTISYPISISSMESPLFSLQPRKLGRSTSTPTLLSSTELPQASKPMIPRHGMTLLEIQTGAFDKIGTIGLSHDELHKAIEELFVKAMLEIPVDDPQAQSLLALTFKLQVGESDRARLHLKMGHAMLAASKLFPSASARFVDTDAFSSSSSSAFLILDERLSALQKKALTFLNPAVPLSAVQLKKVACTVFLEMCKHLDGTHLNVFNYLKIAYKLTNDHAEIAQLLLVEVKAIYKVKGEGFLDRAISLLGRGMDLNITINEKVQFLFRLAEAYFMKSNITPVFDALERALSWPGLSEGKRADILFYLARAYLLVNNMPKALEHFNKALQVSPTHTQSAALCDRMKKAFIAKDKLQGKLSDKSKQNNLKK